MTSSPPPGLGITGLLPARKKGKLFLLTKHVSLGKLTATSVVPECSTGVIYLIGYIKYM